MRILFVSLPLLSLFSVLTFSLDQKLDKRFVVESEAAPLPDPPALVVKRRERALRKLVTSGVIPLDRVYILHK